MKNKGFTLIELLAVIVILAIIALIATPIILNIINDSRIGARERTAELIVSEVTTAYSTAYMKTGVAPTVAEVQAKFSMDKATWAEGSTTITSTDGVTCTVSVTDNKMKVACTGDDITTKESTADMLVSGE